MFWILWGATFLACAGVTVALWWIFGRVLSWWVNSRGTLPSASASLVRWLAGE